MWSSKKRPWNGGKGRVAVVKAFSVVSLPFVLAEASTGIASFFSGELRIPPSIGIGTAVDLASLLAGLVILIMRVLKVKSSKDEVASEPKGQDP